MLDSKKKLLKNILLMLLGLIPVVLIDISKNWVVISLQIVGAILAGINLIYIFVNLQFYLDDISPTDTFDEKPKTKIDKIIITTVNVLFLLSAIFMAIETDRIDNTIEGMKLYWISGFIGILISIFLILRIKKISKTIYSDSTRRYTILLGIPFGLLMLIPATASFTNRQIAETKVLCKRILIEKKSTGSRSKTSYIYCQIGNKSERFVVSGDFFDTLIAGEAIELCVQKGIFGFEFVREFKLPD